MEFSPELKHFALWPLKSRLPAPCRFWGGEGFTAEQLAAAEKRFDEQLVRNPQFYRRLAQQLYLRL